jgi:hypothetical protein
MEPSSHLNLILTRLVGTFEAAFWHFQDVNHVTLELKDNYKEVFHNRYVTLNTFLDGASAPVVFDKLQQFAAECHIKHFKVFSTPRYLTKQDIDGVKVRSLPESEMCLADPTEANQIVDFWLEQYEAIGIKAPPTYIVAVVMKNLQEVIWLQSPRLKVQNASKSKKRQQFIL